MSAPNKNRAKSEGKPESELTRLKDLWPRLSEDARAFWSELFASSASQASNRAQLLAKLKINLRFDKQLTDFRKWVEREETVAAQAERMEENRRRIRREHPDWTLDEILEEVMKVSAEEALASGDHELGLKTVDRDLSRKRTSLEARRISILEKKAAAYDRAQAALEDAKKTKGGITPETLTRIEQELRLL
jgi:hypothetical protein